MKEDLAIARNSLMALQAENSALRKVTPSQGVAPCEATDRVDPEMVEALAEEKRKRQELERELELQVCFVLLNERDYILKIYWF